MEGGGISQPHGHVWRGHRVLYRNYFAPFGVAVVAACCCHEVAILASVFSCLWACVWQVKLALELYLIRGFLNSAKPDRPKSDPNSCVPQLLVCVESCSLHEIRKHSSTDLLLKPLVRGGKLYMPRMHI